jgi:hypothetical protein
LGTIVIFDYSPKPGENNDILMKNDLISYEMGSFSFIESHREQFCFIDSNNFKVGVMWFRTSYQAII